MGDGNSAIQGSAAVSSINETETKQNRKRKKNTIIDWKDQGGLC